MQQRVKQGAFYRIPKELFTEWRFRDLSAESKLMFGILFDRYSLSMMNNWKDEYGDPIFQKDLIKALLNQGRFDDALAHVPNDPSDCTPGWHKILFARALENMDRSVEALPY